MRNMILAAAKVKEEKHTSYQTPNTLYSPVVLAKQNLLSFVLDMTSYLSLKSLL